MALDTYANLKTEIANYLNRSDLTEHLDTFIDLAEARHSRDLRVREMETIDTSITTVAGTLQIFLEYIMLEQELGPHLIIQ